MGSDRQARIGENEAIFRRVNEAVEQAAEQAHIEGDIRFLCECADAFCAEDIPLSPQGYERVRAVGSHFIVRPGHFYPDVEVIIDRHTDYWIVEKTGEAERIAEATDPRH